jgi:hypothetical protein
VGGRDRETAWLPTPFFAPPQALIEVYLDDWPRLAGSAANTLKLLSLGFAYGVAVGFAVGVSIGWSRRIGYWVHPVLRVLGPVPATALLPLTFYFFPTSYSAAAFLIALATGFPVAVLTWSGVASVNKQLLRRGPHARRERPLPGAARGDSGRAAARVRRHVHGAQRIVHGARRGRDDGRQVGARLVSELGAGLGIVREHVCGADRDGAAVPG